MISIRIGDSVFDTNEKIAITLAASEIGKLETRQGSSTNQFTIPLTSEVSEAFGFPDQINATFNPYRRIEGELISDDELISKGYFQINGVTERDVSLTFFGDNADWFNVIKGFKLTEIDLSDIDHAWSEANIVNSWVHDWTDGYVYPAIQYGLMNSFAQTEIYHWYPATFLRYLIKKGLEQKGYKMGGDLLREDFFNSIIIPFSKQDFLNAANIVESSASATRASYQIIATATETKIDFNSKNDPDGYWDIVTNDRFTAPVNGNYEFSIGVSSLVLTPSSLEVRVKINGVLEDTFTPPALNPLNLNFSKTYELSATDYLEVFIYHTIGVNYTMRLAHCTIDVSNKLAAGNTIAMKFQQPDIEFSDLLKWVGFTFGIVFTFDIFTKTINFNLFKSIPDNTPLDWTEKLLSVKNHDYSKPIENYGKINYAKYLKNDDDVLLKSYESATKLPFGTGAFTINNEFNKGNVDVYEAPFAGTVNINGPEGAYIPFIQRYSTKLNNDGTLVQYQDADLNPLPRILVLHADDGLNFTVYGAIDVGITTGETSCAYASFYKIEYNSNTNAYLRSLAYAVPQLGNPNDDAIFQSSYWNRYLQILSAPKMLECEMYLTKADIATLDFTIPVYLDSLAGLFYINKVKEYTGEGSTLVELVKL